MSQSTELPDLDRLSELSDEALGALKPWVVRQIISVASRAKPEGEAPQAAAPDAMTAFRKWHQEVGDQDCEYTWLQAWTAAQLSKSASAPGTPEAPKELGLDIAVAVNQRISKYIAGNKPALMLLNEEELAALYRFQETCEDSDSGGYDVDKDMMKRLAAIGVIESKGFGRYQFTEFGDFVVERAAQLDGGQGESV